MSRCLYNKDNTSWKVLAYGIYALVVFVSEILLVRCAHSFEIQAEISWRQSPYNFKVLGSRTGYKAMCQTLYTFERGKADLLEGDAHGRVLKNVETFCRYKSATANTRKFYYYMCMELSRDRIFYCKDIS